MPGTEVRWHCWIKASCVYHFCYIMECLFVHCKFLASEDVIFWHESVSVIEDSSKAESQQVVIFCFSTLPWVNFTRDRHCTCVLERKHENWSFSAQSIISKEVCKELRVLLLDLILPSTEQSRRGVVGAQHFQKQGTSGLFLFPLMSLSNLPLVRGQP